MTSQGQPQVQNNTNQRNSSQDLQYLPLRLNVEWNEKEGRLKQVRFGQPTLIKVEPDKKTDGVIPRDSLLQNLKDNQAEIMMVITMYNEDDEELNCTLRGIFKNLFEFQEKYGLDTDRIGVVIVSDGREKMHKSIIQMGKEHGFFSQNKISEYFPDGKYELDKSIEGWQLGICHTFMVKLVSPEKSNYPKMNLFFAIKEKNMRKLNSHLWFFGGFCEYVQPKYVFLIDIGTEALEGGLTEMWVAMDNNKKIGGCCGEIKPRQREYFNFLIMAQRVEYKFAHILDKTLESVIGYITVLPGAFSAYRWKAISHKPEQDFGPLWEHYFKSMRQNLSTCMEANMYLAEDRVLCLAIISRPGKDYILKFCHKSVAETDVPATFKDLLLQRRRQILIFRWINGSWFALIHTLTEFRNQMKHSKHSWCRTICIYFLMFYYWVNVILAWVMVGSTYFILDSIIQSIIPDKGTTLGLFKFGQILSYFYILLLTIVFVLALGVKPHQAEKLYLICSNIFGVYMIIGFIFMIIYSVKSIDDFAILIFFAATIFIFASAVLFFCTAKYILTGVLQFLWITPTYVNIFMIYAICNIHDVTWGNRADALTAEEEKMQDSFKAFRTKWVIIWVVTNVVFAYIFITAGQTQECQYITRSIIFIGMGILVLRSFGCFLYRFSNCCSGTPNVKRQEKKKKSIKQEDLIIQVQDNRQGNGQFQMNLQDRSQVQQLQNAQQAQAGPVGSQISLNQNEIVEESKSQIQPKPIQNEGQIQNQTVNLAQPTNNNTILPVTKASSNLAQPTNNNTILPVTQASSNLAQPVNNNTISPVTQASSNLAQPTNNNTTFPATQASSNNQSTGNQIQSALNQVNQAQQNNANLA